MAGNALGPAALLQVYLSHDRLAECVALVTDALEAWSKQDPRTRRARSHVVWFPYRKIEALRARLATDMLHGARGQQGLLEQLDAAVKKHMDLVAMDTPAAPA